MDRVAYYHAAKIRADCRQIYSKLLGRFLMVMILAPQHINVLYIASDSIRQWHITFFQEFFYSVTTDHFYARLYFEIWKRVAKQKVWIFVWICRTKKFTVLFFSICSGFICLLITGSFFPLEHCLDEFQRCFGWSEGQSHVALPVAWSECWARKW